MFRPLTLLGVILIAIAVFSMLLIPGWRSSPLSLGVLLVCLVIGAYAIVKDSLDFWQALKKKQEKMEQGQRREDEE